MDEKYTHESIEPKWMQLWEQAGIYKYDALAPRENTFVVDTPPPTVSGSLHVGHIFSYTQTDVIVRYQRMLGKSIFYPIGWDDNGLPTERRVQNYFNIRCQPHLPYDANWKATQLKNDESPPKDVARKNFIEACMTLTREDEAAFEQLFRRVSLSFDWSLQYSTIDPHCQKLSQLSFLDLVEKKLLIHAESPTMWDVTFQSAIAQAELEDREIGGFFHDIEFAVEGGGSFVISTTRPELLSACIAVVAHPDDERYKPLFGKRAITPLFHLPVPIEPAMHADPEKGTGIMMVCTFGDIMDVSYWKQSKLPLRQIIDKSGRLQKVDFTKPPFSSLNAAKAAEAYANMEGLTVKQAQKKVVELLGKDDSKVNGSGRALIGDPKPITHPVKFYEKGDRPLEFIPTRQWFIKILEHKNELVEQGRQVKWHPSFMLSRYEHWVNGLNQDWCISRQRYFGVPIPAWYKLDANGVPQYENPIYPDKKSLPIDPLSEVPTGFTEAQRDKPNGFTGDPDVMDTWATSALTPQIESHWLLDPKRHAKLFPMDIRPQAHDIIRTWAFSTITKAWMHEGKIPWHHAVISGFIMDPDRKKMSKSKGNVVTPQGLIDEHSADSVRYWASRAKLGMDTAFDVSLFKIGRKLTTKIFNASRFLLLQFERLGLKASSFSTDMITVELDRAMVDQMRQVIETASSQFEQFDYAGALQATEDFFWVFCDHYLELVKVRAYKEEALPERDSALAALAWALKSFLQLFAPVLPFVTEEVWSHSFKSTGRNGSVHTSAWPSTKEVADVTKQTDDRSFRLALEVIGKIRGAKTEAKRNLRWEVEKLDLHGPKELLSVYNLVKEDIIAAGNVRVSGITFHEGAAAGPELLDCKVELAQETQNS